MARLEIVFVESGGDNLAATFSPELADLTIYVIDVAAGDKIPRKGGPGITRSDLLVINKIDLAPLVGANLDVMDRDARKMRGAGPSCFSNLKENKGVDEVAVFCRPSRKKDAEACVDASGRQPGVPIRPRGLGFLLPFTGLDHLLARSGWAGFFLVAARKPARHFSSRGPFWGWWGLEQLPDLRA